MHEVAQGGGYRINNALKHALLIWKRVLFPHVQNLLYCYNYEYTTRKRIHKIIKLVFKWWIYPFKRQFKTIDF